MNATTAVYARRYCQLGFALTWSEPGIKGPRHRGWNLHENAITDPAAAFEFWSAHPRRGIGILLGYSELVSLDVDDAATSAVVLEHLGISLAALRASAPCITGRADRFRLMFRAPGDATLRHRAVAWPEKADPKRGRVLFELRAGAVSDAAPPTLHATTGEPYRWAPPPREGFPTLPAALLAAWTNWRDTERQVRSLCPWAPPAPTLPTRPAHPRRTQVSVIEQFNQAHDVQAILEAHGYVRRGRRFASPDTSHAAGVAILESGKVWCHHVGDPLAIGRALDAFDLFRIFEHGGDYRGAVRAAAAHLGLDRREAA